MTSENPNDRNAELIRKNQRMGLIVIATVVGMIALSFAAVPLYSLFCRMTGFAGTPIRSTELPGKIIDRTITIKFDANTDAHLPWDFKPEQREINVKLGEKGLTAYEARNKTAETVTGTALYNVTPDKAGKYFHKIQCFCFGEQTLKPGEDVSMPVMFFVDPSLNDDPNMNDVTTITLSYTFYKVDTPALDKAMEGFYNTDQDAIKSTK